MLSQHIGVSSLIHSQTCSISASVSGAAREVKCGELIHRQRPVLQSPRFSLLEFDSPLQEFDHCLRVQLGGVLEEQLDLEAVNFRQVRQAFQNPCSNGGVQRSGGPSCRHLGDRIGAFPLGGLAFWS